MGKHKIKFNTKTIHGGQIPRISKPFYPTNNIEEDFMKLKLFFRGIKGKVEEFS